MLKEQLDQEVDFFLEHFGAKGMKWGVRKDRSGPTGRQMNKASRQKDTAKYKSDIDKARARIQSGKTKTAFKKAKGEHAANKAKLGSREARKILNKAREKKYKDVNNAQAVRDGKEAALVIGAGIGAAILLTALRNA